MYKITLLLLLTTISSLVFSQTQDTISYNTVFIYCTDPVFGETRANIGEQHTFTLDREKIKRSIYYTKGSAISNSVWYSYDKNGKLASLIKYSSEKPTVSVKLNFLPNGKVGSEDYSEFDSGKKLAMSNVLYKYDKIGNVKQKIFNDSLGESLLKLSFKYDKMSNIKSTKYKGDISVAEEDIILSAKYIYNSSGNKESEIYTLLTKKGVKEFHNNKYLYNSQGKLDSIFVETPSLKYKQAYHYKDDGEFYYYERFMDGKKVYQWTVNWYTNGKKREGGIISM